MKVSKLSNFTARVKEVLEMRLSAITYAELAALLGSSPRGVGSALRALARRGFFDLCCLVIFTNKKSG